MADIADHREIYKLVVGMFAAAPGVVYFDALHEAINDGFTLSQLYNALANTIAFQSGGPGFNLAATNIGLRAVIEAYKYSKGQNTLDDRIDQLIYGILCHVNLLHYMSLQCTFICDNFLTKN